jgi:hypothetical protein
MSNNEWAPIALFIYKRPDHARRAILSLQACEGFESSPIFVFADGPRGQTDAPAVRATRAVAKDLLGGTANYVEAKRNRGLANSVIAGTTQLCNRYGTVVAVEDDLILAPTFLRFLNESLARYRDQQRVMQVSGHMFDVPSLSHQREALFLPMTTSWGWATWKRAWDLFDPEAVGWRERLGDAVEANRFNLDGRFDYLSMLKRQMNGQIDSWAIRWYYTVFAHNGLALFPPRSLVSNTGFDGTGTHDRLGLPAIQAPLVRTSSFELPKTIAESDQQAEVFNAISAFRSTSARQKVSALIRAGLRAARFV